MKTNRLWLAIVALVPSMAAAQNTAASLPLTAQANPQTSSLSSNAERVTVKAGGHPPFCPPRTCLYYAGDFDSANSNANGLANESDPGVGLEVWAWVGVKPPHAVTVTGVTFNQFFASGFVGTNPTPFQTRVNIVPNSGGTLVCNTTGNATMKQYGESDFGYIQYSYTVNNLAKPCKIAKPSDHAPSTYVNLLPTTENVANTWLANVEDANPANHRGWKNDLDDCYYYVADGPQWVPCNEQGVFDELSIALTGKR